MTELPVRIAVLPPVPVAGLRREVVEPAGDWTLRDVADATGLPADGLGISLDGEIIPPEEWGSRYPASGQSVIVSTRPGGLEVITSIATAIGTATGTGAFVSTALAVALYAGAIYATSRLSAALLAPEGASTDATGPAVRRTIAGDNNAFRPYDTIPQVLGRHRFYPPLAARSYTIVEDGKLFQYALFTFGFGTLTLSELKIGDEPLFRASTSVIYTGTMLADADKWVMKRDSAGTVTKSAVELELRQGTGSDAAIELFSANVQEQVLGKRLRRIHGGSAPKEGDPDPVTHRTADRAVRITVIVGCPAGLIWRRDSGKVTERTVIIDVDYRSATSTGGWTSLERLKMTAATMSSKFASKSWTVTEGTYDVRLTRRSEEGSDPGIVDQTEWLSMLTHRAGDVVTVTGLCLVSMKAQITGNFSRPVDQFNAIAQTVALDWNGSSWAAAATSNPASLFRHVLQGAANKRAVANSQLNLTKLQAWHVECAAAGLEFNAVTQGRATVIQLLRQIATAGRASPGIVDGLFSVVTENTLAGAAVQHFTPRNIKSFEERRVLVEPPHAFKVQWVDPDSGWLDTERIVPADGYTETSATTFERLDLAGITDSDQAYLLGRYHMATLLLRPAEYVIETDVEHIDCIRGDWVRLNHDVILVGLAAGRVLSVTMSGTSATGVVVDQECPMAAATYALRFRKSDGTTLHKVVTTVAGLQTSLTFAAAITAGNPMPVAGDLFLFGESGSESIDLVVKQIEPLGDLDARVTCVDAAAAVLTTGTIPRYSPGITIPPRFQWSNTKKPRIVSVTTSRAGDLKNTARAKAAGIRIIVQPQGVTVQP